MTIRRVSPAEALELVRNGHVYVDVRSEPEFREGHPEGSLNIPWMNMGPGGGGMVANPDFLATMRERFATDAAIVVGCKSGGRSLRAAQALEGAGFTAVVDQRAGWDGARDAFGQIVEPGWSRAGLPVAK